MFARYGVIIHGQKLGFTLNEIYVEISVLEAAAKILQIFGNNEKTSWDTKNEALRISNSFQKLINQERAQINANYVDDDRSSGSR